MEEEVKLFLFVVYSSYIFLYSGLEKSYIFNVFLYFFMKNEWTPCIYHRAIIFHMVIDLGKAKTPFDFGFTRLKVKVTRVTCKKCTHGFCSFF